MALDFPSSPTNGQYYNGFIWNAANGSWDSAYAPRAATIPISSPNVIINGAFDIWQRGTSGFTGAGAHCADRWIAWTGSGSLSVSRSSDVPASSGLMYSLSLASTNGTNSQILQRIESSMAAFIAGKTITLSVWAKSTVGTVGISWGASYANSVDNFAAKTGDASGAFTASMTVGSWTRYTATFTASTSAVNGYEIAIYRNDSSTSTTTLYSGVQLEVGSVATDFRRNAPSIQAELAACQRYFETGSATDIYLVSNNSYAQYLLGAGNYPVMTFKVVKRVIPSARIWFSNVANIANILGTNSSVGVFNISNASVQFGINAAGSWGNGQTQAAFGWDANAEL